MTYMYVPYGCCFTVIMIGIPDPHDPDLVEVNDVWGVMIDN
jgi:hypothetical protein